MAKPKFFGPYRRLAPVRMHLGGYSSLWLAKDYLMAVQSTGYSDKYSRFYLRDIQGFMVEDSERRFYWGVVLGLLGAGFVLTSLLVRAHWAYTLAWLLLFGIPLAWNHVKGPGCKLYIITQVQTSRLQAISRRARCEEIIEFLRPLIEEAQAGLSRPGNLDTQAAVPVAAGATGAAPLAEGSAGEPAAATQPAEPEAPGENSPQAPLNTPSA